MGEGPNTVTGHSRPSERVQVNVLLPVHLRTRLRVVAAERDTSMSHLVAKAVSHYLTHLLPPLGPAGGHATPDDRMQEDRESAARCER